MSFHNKETEKIELVARPAVGWWLSSTWHLGSGPPDLDEDQGVDLVVPPAVDAQRVDRALGGPPASSSTPST